MALRALLLAAAFVIVQIENLSCLLCSMVYRELPMITFLACVEYRGRSFVTIENCTMEYNERLVTHRDIISFSVRRVERSMPTCYVCARLRLILVNGILHFTLKVCASDILSKMALPLISHILL